MTRFALLLVGLAIAGATGCAQCDTCDDFPAPCVGPNCGQNGYNTGGFIPPTQDGLPYQAAEARVPSNPDAAPVGQPDPEQSNAPLERIAVDPITDHAADRLAVAGQPAASRSTLIVSDRELSKPSPAPPHRILPSVGLSWAAAISEDRLEPTVKKVRSFSNSPFTDLKPRLIRVRSITLTR